MVTLVRPNLACISKQTVRHICPHFQRRPLIEYQPTYISHAVHSFSRTRRYYASSSNPNPGQEPFRLWPFLAITLVGSGAYVLMVKSRIEMPPIEQPIALMKDIPVFSPSKVTVIFVLGGPGAGKGTQCANLVRDYNFTHLSAGDLLRAEQDRSGSTYGDLIKTHIKEGIIVPMEVTIKLLENAMAKIIEKDPEGKGRFLIDGFPRKMDQAKKFEENVCKGKLVLFYDCPEEEMQRRLLKRGQNSGRTDDNIESISKRFLTFTETSMPVVRYFEAQNRVVKIDATMSPEEVYKETCRLLDQKLDKEF